MLLQAKQVLLLTESGSNICRSLQCRFFADKVAVVPFYNHRQAIWDEGKVYEKDFFIPTELNIGDILYDRIKKSWYLAQLEMLTRHYRSNMELRHIAAMLKESAKQVRKPNFIRFAAKCSHVRNEREVRKPILNRLKTFLPLPAGQEKVTIIKSLALAKMEGRRGFVAGLLTDLIRDIPVQIEAFSLQQKANLLYSCANIPKIALHLPDIICASILQQLNSSSYNPEEATPTLMAMLYFAISRLKYEEQQSELIDVVLNRFLDELSEEKPLTGYNISLLLFSLATTGRKLEGELQYEVLKKLDQIIEQLSRQQLSHVFFGLGVLGHLTDERLKKLKKQIHKVLLTTTPEQTYYMVYGLAKSGNVDEQLLFNMRLRVGEFVGWKRATEKNALSMVRCLYRMGSTEDECRWTLRGVYPPQYKQAYLDGDLKDVRDFFHTREDKWYPHFPNYYGDNLHYPFRYAVNDIKQYQPDAKQPI
eukprot:TRINITY_DN7278_c0_g1_i4.p1 TRINITY_DN7278_c0_g1~~TRINITY_DN7278_c0_g1_i4.p1  ORF type:complete len:476 (+),score=50.38 TRINITY_DN7278_c0_g1_i4:104-1531(+)